MDHLVPKEKSIFDNFRKSYLSAAASLILPFLPLTANSNTLESRVNSEIVDNKLPDNSNTLSLDGDGKKDDKKRQLSCECLGIANLQRTKNYGVPVGSYAGTVFNLNTHLPITLNRGEYISLSDLININYNNAKVETKILANDGFSFLNNQINALNNGNYIVLNIKAIDNKTGCTEGIVIPILSKEYFSNQFSSSGDLRNGKTDLSDDDFKKHIKQTLDTFQQTIDSLSKVAPEIRTDTIYVQEQDTAKVQEVIKQFEQKRTFGFGAGYTGHNLNLPASMYVKGSILTGNFEFSLEGIFPTEGNIYGVNTIIDGNQPHNELLSANVNQKGQINLSGQYIIPLVKGQENDILTLGLGAYGAAHLLEGSSRIDIQSVLINGTLHTNEGLPNQISMIYSAGPSANFGIILSPVLQLNLGAKYNVLGNAPFDKDGIFSQNKTDSYHPFTLQGGATIYLPIKSEKRTGDLK
jgi:hypothetical protein